MYNKLLNVPYTYSVSQIIHIYFWLFLTVFWGSMTFLSGACNSIITKDKFY
jgi:hypothetical protein